MLPGHHRGFEQSCCNSTPNGSDFACLSFGPLDHDWPSFLPRSPLPRPLAQVEGGDMVYYPAGYWHQTENLDDENIAFSTTLVDNNNFQAVEYEMRQEEEEEEA